MEIDHEVVYCSSLYSYNDMLTIEIISVLFFSCALTPLINKNLPDNGSWQQVIACQIKFRAVMHEVLATYETF